MGAIRGEAVILGGREGGGSGAGVPITGGDIAWFADGQFPAVVAGDIDDEEVLAAIFDVAVPVSVEQFAEGASFDGRRFGSGGFFAIFGIAFGEWQV